MSARDMQSTLCETIDELVMPQRRSRVATLSGFDDKGRPLVHVRDAAAPQPAQTIVDLTFQNIGQAVLILFEEDDLARPIVLGLIQPNKSEHAAELPKQPRSVSVYADGERLIFEAEKEIVLRCGKASITLTRAGKVLIRGAYLSSLSSGIVRVSGATVRLN